MTNHLVRILLFALFFTGATTTHALAKDTDLTVCGYKAQASPTQFSCNSDPDVGTGPTSLANPTALPKLHTLTLHADA